MTETGVIERAWKPKTVVWASDVELNSSVYDVIRDVVKYKDVVVFQSDLFRYDAKKLALFVSKYPSSIFVEGSEWFIYHVFDRVKQIANSDCRIYELVLSSRYEGINVRIANKNTTKNLVCIYRLNDYSLDCEDVKEVKKCLFVLGGMNLDLKRRLELKKLAGGNVNYVFLGSKIKNKQDMLEKIESAEKAYGGNYDFLVSLPLSFIQDILALRGDKRVIASEAEKVGESFVHSKFYVIKSIKKTRKKEWSYGQIKEISE